MNAHNMTSVELAPVASRSSTLTGTAVNIRDYAGRVRVTQYSAALSTGDTLDGKLQDSADGSTGWADITGAVFAQVDDQAGGFETIVLDTNKVKRFVRYIGTLAGGSITGIFGAMLDGVQQQEP